MVESVAQTKQTSKAVILINEQAHVLVKGCPDMVVEKLLNKLKKRQQPVDKYFLRFCTTKADLWSYHI